ncbi:MAG: hypothetical protein SH850_08575 [Planctomycetaceae bacterium]|nr:hypothetical protein [Planctomycetaceae bacterium]
MTKAELLNHSEPRAESHSMRADEHAGFWQNLGDAFEKRTASFESMPASVQRIDQAALYRALMWCGEHMKDSQVRFYHHRSDDTVWNMYSPSPLPAAVLPIREDGSLAVYIDRMRRQIASPDGYSIFVTSVIKHDEFTWRVVRGFVRELVRRVGLPPRGFDAGFGLGQYDFTPSGVHADTGRSAYILPIVGSKRFRIWTDDYARQHPDLANVRGRYDTLKKDSLELEAGPGGLLYWPENGWHIYEGDGEFTAMLSLGAFVGEQVANLPCDVDKLQELAQTVPDSFSVKAIKDTPIRTQNAPVEQVWLGFLSGLGLRYPIPSRHDALPDGPLRGDRDPILWRALPDGRIAIGVNGHCIVDSGNWLTPLVERINARVPFAVAEVVSDPAGSAVRAMLERLWACGALRNDSPLVHAHQRGARSLHVPDARR